MIKFKSEIEKFGQKGEKTGWTFVFIPSEIAEKINPGVKKSYRVKGLIDKCNVNQLAMVPMGNGDFIIALNAELRKKIKKQKGDTVELNLDLDKAEFVHNSDLLECLRDEKEAEKFFKSLPLSHQKYYSKWIDSAKTIETKSKRIAQSIEGFKMKMGYPEMIRYFKSKKG